MFVTLSLEKSVRIIPSVTLHGRNDEPLLWNPVFQKKTFFRRSCFTKSCFPTTCMEYFFLRNWLSWRTWLLKRLFVKRLLSNSQLPNKDPNDSHRSLLFWRPIRKLLPKSFSRSLLVREIICSERSPHSRESQRPQEEYIPKNNPFSKQLAFWWTYFQRSLLFNKKKTGNSLAKACHPSSLRFISRSTRLKFKRLLESTKLSLSCNADGGIVCFVFASLHFTAIVPA